MANTRRMASGAVRGKFRRKKMGKGWAAHHKVRGHTIPVVRLKPEGADEAEKKTESQSGDAKSDS